MRVFYSPYGASVLALSAALMLGACGHSQGDRIASGAGVGAGVGAAAGALAGGSATTGALLGAGVGAAAGGLTKEDDVNLGKPIWRR
jgi:osmotically inducible lipoprotein OsmB